MSAFSFPTDEQCLADGQRLTRRKISNRATDSLNFEIAIPKTWRQIRDGHSAPIPKQPFVDLAGFQDLPSPTRQVVVQASAIQHEVGLSDYLSHLNQLDGYSLIEQRLADNDPDQPDRLIRRKLRNGQVWIGRQTAYKVGIENGAYVVVLNAGCLVAQYRKDAGLLDRIVKSFGPASTPDFGFAERLKIVSQRMPIDFASYLPASWKEIQPSCCRHDEMRRSFVKLFRGRQIGGLTIHFSTKERYPRSRDFVRQALLNWNDVSKTKAKIDLGPRVADFSLQRGITRLKFERDPSRNYDLEFYWGSFNRERLYIELVGPDKKQDFEAWAINRRALQHFFREFRCQRAKFAVPN
jgi:hypothetical protein